MKNIIIASVVAFLLCSTTNITAYASTTLISTSFRTNLVKGEYVDEEVLKPEESIDGVLDDATEEIIADPDEKAEPESQGFDEHTDVSTPTDIGPVIDDDTVEREELIETDTTEPDETIEEYIGEAEEENETEVQESE